MYKTAELYNEMNMYKTTELHQQNAYVQNDMNTFIITELYKEMYRTGWFSKKHGQLVASWCSLTFYQ